MSSWEAISPRISLAQLEFRKELPEGFTLRLKMARGFWMGALMHNGYVKRETQLVVETFTKEGILEAGMKALPILTAYYASLTKIAAADAKRKLELMDEKLGDLIADEKLASTLHRKVLEPEEDE